MRKVRKGASPEEIRDQKKYDAGIRGGEDYTIFDELSDRDKANIEKVLAGEMSIELVPDEFRRHIIIKQYIEKVLAGEMSIERVPGEFRRPVKREVVLARADLEIQNRQQETNEGAKMSITRSMIRRLVNETLSNLFEEEEATESYAEIVARKAAEVAKEEEKAANIKAADAKVKVSTAQAASDMLKANSMKSEQLSIRKNILIEMRKQGII